MDKVDKIVKQWHQARPDLNVSAMEVIGRFKKTTQHFETEMNKTFAAHGLNAASFDVLATLRRSGEPYALSPNELIATTMVTSGTMTNRIDQLVKAGLVERIKRVEDRRSVAVSLTKKGFDVIDGMLVEHVATQNRLTALLTDEEQATLNQILRKYLTGIESE